MKDIKKGTVNIYGAGLAGCEAAWQAAKRGVKVELYEMKPAKFTPAHHSPKFAELVCSNSLRSDSVTNAVGLLKEEMSRLGSLIMEAALATRVPAGSALAVDRELFSEYITEKIKRCDNITLHEKEADCVSNDTVSVIATGPLTSDLMADYISGELGMGSLHFFDAAAPIIEKDSIDMNIAFYGDRYGKVGDNSYINLPMNKEEYLVFYNELVNAEIAELHEFDKKEIFEGCMPIEIMAKRGEETLRFGPLKPVGFTNPHDGTKPYAIVQLRQDNSEGTLYNIVGFQTNLKFGEQKRVFSMLPGLKNANFAKYGVMHRNTYINSTKLLDETYNLKENNRIYFAGQITGVEGYVESISSGLVAAVNACEQFNETGMKITYPETTMIGCLAKYISTEHDNFQPMNANFGILPVLDKKIRDKKERYEALAKRSLEYEF